MLHYSVEFWRDAICTPIEFHRSYTVRIQIFPTYTCLIYLVSNSLCRGGQQCVLLDIGGKIGCDARMHSTTSRPPTAMMNFTHSLQ